MPFLTLCLCTAATLPPALLPWPAPLLQDGATFFCATPLAASLCGGTAAAAAGGAEGSGPGSKEGGAGSSLHTDAYIIVETNFRVRGVQACVCGLRAWRKTCVGACHTVMPHT